MTLCPVFRDWPPTAGAAMSCTGTEDLCFPLSHNNGLEGPLIP